MRLTKYDPRPIETDLPSSFRVFEATDGDGDYWYELTRDGIYQGRFESADAAITEADRLLNIAESENQDVTIEETKEVTCGWCHGTGASSCAPRCPHCRGLGYYYMVDSRSKEECEKEDPARPENNDLDMR
jgi:RecJ-like exonuclease